MFWFPVLRLRSQRGNELLVTWTRNRWPTRNTLQVDHRSISTRRQESALVATRTMPSQRFTERPSGCTSQSRATQSVDGAELSACNTTRTRPVTSRSSPSGADVKTHTSGRVSIAVWSHGPDGKTADKTTV